LKVARQRATGALSEAARHPAQGLDVHRQSAGVAQPGGGLFQGGDRAGAAGHLRRGGRGCMLVDAQHRESGKQPLFAMPSVALTPTVVGGSQRHGAAALELDAHLPLAGRFQALGGFTCQRMRRFPHGRAVKGRLGPFPHQRGEQRIAAPGAILLRLCQIYGTGRM
jgi:hypothetical protein